MNRTDVVLCWQLCCWQASRPRWVTWRHSACRCPG